jgi:hypothetical protein
MMKIGQIETTGEPGRRDAFHVPAVLVTCAGIVTAGNAVRFSDSSFSSVLVVADNARNRHAIVDPFIAGTVRPGQLFWVLLMPGMIKDKLTHQFDLNIEDVPAPEPESSDDEDDQCKGCW